MKKLIAIIVFLLMAGPAFAQQDAVEKLTLVSVDKKSTVYKTGDTLELLDFRLTLKSIAADSFTVSFPAGLFLQNPAEACSATDDAGKTEDYVFSNAHDVSCLYQNVCDAMQMVCIGDVRQEGGSLMADVIE